MTDKNLATRQLKNDELLQVQNNRELVEALTVSLDKIDREWARSLAQEATLALLYRLRTSIDPRFTLQDQADIFGMSVTTMKRWAASDEYTVLASELASPSRAEIIAEARAVIEADLLPVALAKLKSLLTDENTRDSVALNAIKVVLEKALGNAPAPDASREEALQYLKDRGIQYNTQIIINNPSVAPDFAKRLSQVVPGDYEEIMEESSSPESSSSRS